MGIIKKYFKDYIDVCNYNEEKIKEILNDKDMIKNEKKIRACYTNALVLKCIVEEHGSFKKYVDSFKPKDSFENLLLFKEEIQYKFAFFGGITSYHFMTDIGLPVLKPDRVITRIFERIGLIEDREQKLKTVIQGQKISEKTGYPIRYVDIILVNYGQLGKDDTFGLDDGICLEKTPKCSICGITEYCKHYQNQ